MSWRERLVWTLGVMALLACLAWTMVTEPLLPDADDCHARGLAEDCWKRVVR